MLVIHEAQPGDVPRLVPLLAAHMVEHQRRFPDAYPRINPTAGAAHYGGDWARRIGVDPRCKVWLADDRCLRGFLAGEVWQRAVGEPGTVFFAEWLYVVPESRGTGIARALWRQLIRFCRSQGISVIEGRTVPGDHQWDRRGWRTGGRIILTTVDELACAVADDGREGTTDAR